MSKTFEEILEGIVTNSDLGKEVDALENFKEIYDIFKREGYEHSEQEFEKEMAKLLKDFSKENLSESELDEIAGGKGNGSRFLAGVLGAMSGFGALSTPKSSAFDISDVKNTVVTKAKQVKDFVKTNPLTTAVVGGGSVFVVGGAVVTSIALHKYLHSIERAIDKLDFSSKAALDDIKERIIDLAKGTNSSANFNEAAKNNKNLQYLEKLGDSSYSPKCI